MLDDTLKTQLGAYLERVTQPFELVATLGDDETSHQMRELLQTIASLRADKITKDRALICDYKTSGVSVEPDRWGRWLDPRVSGDDLLDLLVPAAPGRLEAYPVATLVNNVRNNGAELLEPLPLG